MSYIGVCQIYLPLNILITKIKALEYFHICYIFLKS